MVHAKLLPKYKDQFSNTHLIGNVSKWKSVYRKYTNFAIQTKTLEFNTFSKIDETSTRELLCKISHFASHFNLVMS